MAICPSNLSGNVLGLDPGTTETGWCIMRRLDFRPLYFGKTKNEDLVQTICNINKTIVLAIDDIAIEMVACYGMPVGAEVFETCVWIGKIKEQLTKEFPLIPQRYIYRKDEKMAICGSMKANDANIRQALVDRFAKGVSNYGKGSKNCPGFFHGFRADIWSAYAVCVTSQHKEFI